MLVKATLQTQLEQSFNIIFPNAFEQVFKNILPVDSKDGKDAAKEFGKTVADMVSGPLADALASAIDYYVHNISLSGTIITAGTPVTQTAIVVPQPPLTAGIVPNSLKVL